MTPDQFRKIRIDSGLTQAALANILSVTPMTLWRWEQPVGAPQHRGMSELTTEGVVAIVNRETGLDLEVSDYV